jgi:hypothetical protein
MTQGNDSKVIRGVSSILSNNYDTKPSWDAFLQPTENWN